QNEVAVRRTATLLYRLPTSSLPPPRRRGSPAIIREKRESYGHKILLMQDNTILGAAINIFMQNMLVRIALNMYNAHSFAQFLYLHCYMKKSALHYLFVTVAG